MAFGAWVQGTSKDAGSVTTSTLAYGSNVGAGNTLVLVIRQGGTGGNAITVSDNLNGNWTKDDEFTVTSLGTHSSWRFSNSAAGACTVTITFNSSTTMRWVQDEYQGSFTLDTNGGIAHSNGTSTSPSSGSLTTSQTCALLGRVLTQNSIPNNTFTAGSGWTGRESLLSSTSDAVVNTEDESTTQVAGSYTATGTLGTSEIWSAQILAYYNASAVAAAPTPAQVTPAELILAQYGVDPWYQVPAPSNVSAGTAATVSASVAQAQGYTTALPTPAQVTPAELILEQYGIDPWYQITAGSSQTQGGTAATVSATVGAANPSQIIVGAQSPVQVTPAELILDQYGIDPYYQVPAPSNVSQGTAVTASPSVAQAQGYTTALPTPPPVTGAELILQQYGISLEQLFAVPAPSNVAYGSAVGITAGIAASAGGIPTPSVPPQVTPAELILEQYGIDPYYQVTAGSSQTQAGAATTATAGVAQAQGYTTALPTPPPITAAELILDQYGFDGAFLVPAPSNVSQGTATSSTASVPVAAGQGVNLGSGVTVASTVGQAAPTVVIVSPSGMPQPVPPDLFALQYGLDLWLLQPAAPPSAVVGVPSGLAALVSPAEKAALIAPTGLAALVSPTEKGGKA